MLQRYKCNPEGHLETSSLLPTTRFRPAKAILGGVLHMEMTRSAPSSHRFRGQVAMDSSRSGPSMIQEGGDHHDRA
jgi:hypothetical protein